MSTTTNDKETRVECDGCSLIQSQALPPPAPYGSTEEQEADAELALNTALEEFADDLRFDGWKVEIEGECLCPGCQEPEEEDEEPKDYAADD